MHGSDVWAIRTGNKYKYCSLGGFYIIAMATLKQESSTREDWHLATKNQFELDYKELKQMLNDEPLMFKEVNNLNQVRELKGEGDCIFLVTPDVTLIARKYGNKRRFISVRKDLEKDQIQT